MDLARIASILMSGLMIGTGCGGEIRVEATGLALIDEATISASDNGRLSKLTITEGQRVKAGSVIAQLDDREQQADLARLKSEERTAREKAANDIGLQIANKELALASLEVVRATELNKKFANTISVSQMERLALIRDQKKLAVEQARREMKMAALKAETEARSVDLATIKLAKRTLRSPIDGIVVEVNHKQGEWIQAGKSLCRVVRVARLQAQAYVSSTQLSEDLAGQRATMIVAIPGRGRREYKGTVTFVSPEANPVNGAVKILARIENHDGRLRAGYVGTLVIQTPATDKSGKRVPAAKPANSQ